jgi:hypothetical protein
MQASPPLTLAAVESEFAEWRRRRSPRHTPSPLKAQAVSLLREHSISQVCQRLRINHGTLTRWRQAVTPEAEAMGFVELGPCALKGLSEDGVSTLATLTLTYTRADGSALSMSGQLSEAQWRWARELLAETGS